MSRLEHQIPSHEHEYRRREDDEVPRGEYEMSWR